MQGGSLLKQTIANYRLVDFVGAGGMGEVYRAVHMRFGTVVAIKMLTCKDQNPNMIERFRNEASIQAQLEHPAIARFHEYVEAGEHLCIVMEYVDGETLNDCIQRVGFLPLDDTLRIFRAVVEAISYLHDHAIVHRDIKSNNIKLTSKGEVKLLDFGIAKSGNSPRLTALGDVIGTFEYLSPEQLKGDNADARSDIWALGVLLYEMLSGRVPFDATTVGRLVEQVSKAEYKPVSTLNSAVPREIEAIIGRCLKKNPAARYQSAHVLLDDLQRASRPASTAIRAPFFSFHKNWQKLAIPVMGMLLILFLSLLTRGHQPLQNQTSAAPNVINPPAAEPTSMNLLQTVQINTFEGSADVYRDGRLIGVTPYQITAPIGGRVSITLKRAGYLDEPLDFAVTENKKEYTITLKRQLSTEW